VADEQVPGGERQSSWGRWVLVAAVVLLAIIVLQNLEEVRIDILIFTSVRMPLIVALLVAALLGAAIGWLAPRVRRHDD
jgi:uncharacterized integral membrane protein